jgi:hypothetical protein
LIDACVVAELAPEFGPTVDEVVTQDNIRYIEYTGVRVLLFDAKR